MELIDNVETKIYLIRGVQVMLDSDLAKLYEVETKYLKRQVKRNFERFNETDFMFQLTKKEFEDLRCQFGTTNFSMTRTEPFAFTEQGVYMLSTVINSSIAVAITKKIMRTFTKMREFTITYKEIVDRLELIEQTIKTDQRQINYNTERVGEALHLLNQILHQTKEVDKNLIGFRPKV
jgi:hypothetical protein